MLYYPSLTKQREKYDSIALTELMKFVYSLVFGELLIPQMKVICDNCDSVVEQDMLKTRHGLLGSYSTCPMCDIELENY